MIETALYLRSSWELTSSQYSIFLSIKVENFSFSALIYSSTCYFFSHINLVHILLDLYVNVSLGDSSINDIVFFVANSTSSLLVYWIWICILTAYPVTLLQWFINPRSFLSNFSNFLHRYHVYVNNDSFIYSFPICIPFISCSCLIALARIASMLFQRSQQKGYLSLCLILVGMLQVSYH